MSDSAPPINEAIQRLFRTWHREVHRYFRRRTECEETADDLTAEVFLQATSGYHRFDPDRGTEVAWLYGIARNCLQAHFRRRRREAALARRLRRPSAVEWASEDSDLGLDLAARAQPLRRALRTLSETDRTMIRMRVMEGRSYLDIARHLDISEGAARVRLHRAISRLRSDDSSTSPG